MTKFQRYLTCLIAAYVHGDPDYKQMMAERVIQKIGKDNSELDSELERFRAALLQCQAFAVNNPNDPRGACQHIYEATKAALRSE